MEFEKHIEKLRNVMQINEGLEEMSTHRVASKVDPSVHKIVAAHLWSGGMGGIKVALFIPFTHEGGVVEWELNKTKPVAFVDYKILQRPDIAFLEGEGAKQFLLQHGYKVNQKNKTLRKISEGELDEGFLGKSPEEKRAEVLRYIESGQNKNMQNMYNQLKAKNPLMADKYVEFFATHDQGYTPVWDGVKFVPHGNRMPLGEESDTPEAAEEPYVHKVPVYLAAMSHLSDIQETCSEDHRKLINFVKALIMKMRDGVQEMSDDELNAIWREWANR